MTVGNDIAINQGFYQPSTAQGQQLLAHELAHVVQQSGAASRTGSGSHQEAAADSAAADLMAGRDARSVLRAGAQVGPQCQQLTSQEIADLDDEQVKKRLATNVGEQEVYALSEDYRAELVRQQALLESRGRQLIDQAALVREVQEALADLTTLVTKMQTDVSAHPADYALNDVREVLRRLEFYQEYAITLATGLRGDQSRKLQLMVERFSGLRVMHKPAVRAAEAWHAANPMGESLEMTNERAGTHMAGVATRHWAKGGWYYVSGAGAYFLTAGVAVVEAAETVASFGFHGVATAVAKAYERGDISWNEGEDLLWDAGKQALIMAAITRGLGAATSRLGFAGARGLGMAARPLAARIAYGATVGSLAGAADLGLQHGVNALLRSHFHSPTARAIADLGKPTGAQWAIAVPLAALLGGAGAGLPNKPIRFGNKDLVGSTLDTSVGRMKVAAVTKEGHVVLQPAAAAKAPPPPPPADIDLFFNPTTGAWEIPTPTGGALVPVKPTTAPSGGSGLVKSGAGRGGPKLIGPPPVRPDLAPARVPAHTPEEMWTLVQSKRGFESSPSGAGDTYRSLPATVPPGSLRLDEAGIPLATGAPLGKGYETFAAVQLVDADGRSVAVVADSFRGGGADGHAEARCVRALESNGPARVAGGKLVVVSDQLICPPAVCGSSTTRRVAG